MIKSYSLIGSLYRPRIKTVRYASKVNPWGAPIGKVNVYDAFKEALTR